jgi:hypothetical protein
MSGWSQKFDVGDAPVFTATITDVPALGRISVGCKFITQDPAGVETTFESGGTDAIESGGTNVWIFIHPVITVAGEYVVRFESTQGLVSAAEMSIQVKHSRIA